jgi:general secretion pathway protein E
MTKAVPLQARSRALPTEPSTLTLGWLLEEMVAADLITAAMARGVSEPPRKKDGTSQHPLVVAATQDWPDRRTEGRKLSLEVLTQWLAHRAHLPYVRIDPLKLDVASMTEIVPYAYAARSGILPIKSGPAGVTFAVKDPFATEWAADLEPVLKVPLKRVCANPSDIDRYLVEFYAIARSVKITGQERSRFAPAELRTADRT